MSFEVVGERSEPIDQEQSSITRVLPDQLIDRARRYVETGCLMPVPADVEVKTFNELRVGTHFRMIAGRWPLIKLSETTAARADTWAPTVTLELAHEFEGSERCVELKGE